MMLAIVYVMFALALACIVLASVEYVRVEKNIARKEKEEREARKKRC